MPRPILFAAVAVGSLLVSPAAAPQQNQQPPPPQEQVTFRTQASEVIVPVTVTDDKGRFLSNLEAKDFRILDEGRPQRIQFFSHSQKQPIVVGFLIDLSSNSRIHWDKYQDAILELVWDLLPGEKTTQGYLIGYSSTAELLVNTTPDSDTIAAKVRRMKPSGGAAFYDAIYIACTNRDLVKGEPYEPRRVIVVVGDGHDSASSHTFDQVLELAQRNLVTIYGVSTQSFGFDNPAEDVLEKLTNDTGGHVEYPLNRLYKDVSGYISTPKDAGNYVYDAGTGGYASEISAGIVKAIEGIAGEVTTQYVLRYIPDLDPEAKPKVFRKIKVEVPSLPTVNIRARNGYYPNGVPGGLPSQN